MKVGSIFNIPVNFSAFLPNSPASNVQYGYIYKSDCWNWQFHFFTTPSQRIFASSCEFNGLVSKSCRIPPAALFLSRPSQEWPFFTPEVSIRFFP
jgi:hypothetical protein